VVVALMLLSCSRPADRSAGAVAALEVPGRSPEFEQMKVPPGQLTRAIPVGAAHPAEAAPAYRSLCLRCHSVSQSSFAVRDWRESLHARAGVMCGSCHGSHEAGFVPQPGPDRCILCHAPQVEEFMASRHAPSRSSGMRCVSCHDVHAMDRGLAKTTTVCKGCHLQSEHVQQFAASRMGQVRTEKPFGDDGSVRAPDCAYCHFPASSLMKATGDFRNDKVTLHDVGLTVKKSERDTTRLAESTIQLLLPLCVQCHSERNARYRLEHSDPLILHWSPLGMPTEVRRLPVAAAPDPARGAP
jgi:hypothetical protein